MRHVYLFFLYFIKIRNILTGCYTSIIPNSEFPTSLNPITYSCQFHSITSIHIEILHLSPSNFQLSNRNPFSSNQNTPEPKNIKIESSWLASPGGCSSSLGHSYKSHKTRWEGLRRLAACSCRRVVSGKAQKCIG